MSISGQPPTPLLLTSLLGDYLRVRRALGYRLEGSEVLLTQFLAYLHEHDADTITIEHALGFATAPAGASARWHALRLSAIRCFARWAAASDPSVQVPPARLLPARPTRAAPYIYRHDQIQALLAAADQLHPAIRAATIHTLIALMASTGLFSRGQPVDGTPGGAFSIVSYADWLIVACATGVVHVRLARRVIDVVARC